MFSMEHQSHDGACRISISGEMTIYSAAEMKEKLAAATAGSGRVELDLADVSEFDSAGAQILALLKRSIAGTLCVVEAGPAVRELLELYRLSGELLSECADPNVGSLL
jgi:anti-sigma B factor antagonist